MYGLMGKMTAQTGQRDTLRDYLLQAARQLEALEGCYLYIVSEALDDPDALWITEVWQNQDHHQASLNHPAIQQLITQARPIIASMTDRTEFTPIGGKGLS